MEFWCFSKCFYSYDNFDRDVRILHFKTMEEGLETFTSYVNMYIDDFELEEGEYTINESEDSYEFLYSDADLDIELSLDKIIL